MTTKSVYNRLKIREKTIVTATQLFIKRGVKAVAMSEIASTMGISKRTIYSFFGDKEGLLLESIKLIQANHQKQITQNIEKTDDALTIIFRSYKMQISEYRRTNLNFYSDLEMYPKIRAYLEKERKDIRDKLITFLERGTKEGIFRSNINYELFALLFETSGRFIMSSKIYRKYPLADIYNSHFFVLVRGLCTEPAVKKLESLIDESSRKKEDRKTTDPVL